MRRIVRNISKGTAFFFVNTTARYAALFNLEIIELYEAKFFAGILSEIRYTSSTLPHLEYMSYMTLHFLSEAYHQTPYMHLSYSPHSEYNSIKEVIKTQSLTYPSTKTLQWIYIPSIKPKFPVQQSRQNDRVRQFDTTPSRLILQ